jgi:hypothetical protein
MIPTTESEPYTSTMGSPALEFPLMVGEVVMVIEEAVVTVEVYGSDSVVGGLHMLWID